MNHRHTIVLLAIFSSSSVAFAQETLDLKGTWIPSNGAHIIEGESLHAPSGTEDVPGHDTAQQHKSKFVFKIEGQDGRRFWGEHASANVMEPLVGVISVDGKRFVMVDKDGTFNGTIENADTLDYCYAHVEPKHMAAACGLLKREK